MDDGESGEEGGEDQADIEQSAITQYASSAAMAGHGRVFGEDVEAGAVDFFTIRGTMVSPNPKKAIVAMRWYDIWRGSSSALPAIPVARASANHRTMSSSTATPRTRRAKRVCRIFRSAKIFETTGTDVTATPTATMMISAMRVPLGPRRGRMSHGPSARAR